MLKRCVVCWDLNSRNLLIIGIYISGNQMYARVRMENPAVLTVNPIGELASTAGEMTKVQDGESVI